MSRVYRLVAADYTVKDGRPYVWVFGRDSLGNKEVFAVHHTPYAYVPSEQVLDHTYSSVKAIDGKMVTRVDARLPGDVAEYGKRYKSVYEDKILFPLRFLIDRGIRFAFKLEGDMLLPADAEESKEVERVPLLVAYVDTESVSPAGSTIRDVQQGKFLTLCVSTAFSDKPNEIISLTARNDSEEKQMWEDWLDLIIKRDPDVVAGWNVAGHDLRVFFERCNRLKINPNRISPMGYMSIREHKTQLEAKINGVNTFEMRDAFRKFFQGRTFDSYQLKPIAADKTILGENALEAEEYPLDKLTPEYMDKVLEYNRRDVQRLINIDSTLHLVEQFDGIARVAGCLLPDTIDTSKYADALLLREYHDSLVLGTKSFNKREVYEGAMVLDPVRGIHENVIALDFSGMYPTIIMSYNISPEMIVDWNDIENGRVSMDDVHNIGGVFFRKRPLGIVPQAIKRMMTHRKEIKKEMKRFDRDSLSYKVLDYRQYGIKQMIAAMYGYFAFPMGRMYYPKLSSSITFCGRKNIMACVGYIIGLGYKVLYGDTDSMLIKVGDISEGELLEGKVNNFLRELAVTEGLNEPPTIEYEIGYRRLLLGKKKRYAGLCTLYKGRASDLIIIKGFEAKRSDSAKFSRDMQTGVLGKILRGAPEPEICNAIKAIWNEFRIEDYNWSELGVPHRLSREPAFYPNGGAAFLGEIFANQYMGAKFGEGSRPFIFWVKRVAEGYPPRIYLNGRWRKVDRVALDKEEDFNKWRPYIDWQTQKERLIEAKLELILTSWGKTLGEILASQTQQKLF